MRERRDRVDPHDALVAERDGRKNTGGPNPH